MERYEEYKDSGTEWIGKIPKDWDCLPLWTLCKDVDDEVKTTGLSIALESVTPWNGKVIVEEENSSQTFDKAFTSGDVLFSKLRPYLAKVVFAECQGDCSGEFLVLRADSSRLYPKYLFWNALSDGFISSVNAATYGTRMPRANWDIIGHLRIPLPSLPKQIEISNYLESATSEIDTLIEETEKSIELLGEYRKSVISEAVTKGLDPDVPMKDSGIEWIGKFPEHWNEIKLQFVLSSVSGATPSKEIEAYWDGDIPWVSSMEAKGKYLNDTTHHITQEAVDSCSTQLSPPGTVVMVVRSGILKHTIPVSILTEPMAVNQDIKAISLLPDCIPEFFQYWIQGHNNALLALYSKLGTTVDSLDFDRLIKARVFLPDTTEQREICLFLNKRIAEIEAESKSLEVLNEKLTEYRKSLISETVTGKIKVPEVK